MKDGSVISALEHFLSAGHLESQRRAAHVVIERFHQASEHRLVRDCLERLGDDALDVSLQIALNKRRIKP